MKQLIAMGAAATAFLLWSEPALAQYAPVDPIPLGHTATSVMGNKLSGDIANRRTRSRSVSSRCLADSGPGPERRAMEAEYARRSRTAGKASADAWRAQRGREYRARLIAQGKCK
ncbi:hypothetical protein RZN05_11185 [Sphingomonas sp. HF-S4]|uniref:Uncharacterized protein n=1 Tax=Sphingomonas agrestis TaxID=3080540 RepID=A0ABU3Y811_9SPHN|nr:hypothetical protein [Sphingomonas sp. HF-S4]MDV3457548.1 hypothetical protein [Sphingomonas sp. HF-S4]